jgi:hypothetical protein
VVFSQAHVLITQQVFFVILSPRLCMFIKGCFINSTGYPGSNDNYCELKIRVMGPDSRAIAQAVSRRLPAAAARVRDRVRSCGICGGQSGAGAGLLKVLPFLLPIFIPPIAPQSSSSSEAGTIGQILATVPSGLSLTPWVKMGPDGFLVGKLESNIIL